MLSTTKVRTWPATHLSHALAKRTCGLPVIRSRQLLRTSRLLRISRCRLRIKKIKTKTPKRRIKSINRNKPKRVIRSRIKSLPPLPIKSESLPPKRRARRKIRRRRIVRTT